MTEEIERWMQEKNVVAVNVHQIGGRFSVHVRHSMSEGFTCSQKSHETLEAALREHLPSTLDLSDLLV